MRNFKRHCKSIFLGIIRFLLCMDALMKLIELLLMVGEIEMLLNAIKHKIKHATVCV